MSPPGVFHRILVALDASPHSLTALDAAADLAALFDVELLGIFVEDADLLRLAEVPLTSEVASFSASTQPLDPERIRLQWRAIAERARRAIAASAERARVRWSFRIARGSVSAVVIDAVGGRDLLSVGRVGWSRLGRTGLGSTVRTILADGRTSALVLRRDRRIGGPVCAVYDGSRAARRGLEAVAHLARGSEVTLLVVATDGEVAERLEHEADERVRALGLRSRFRRLGTGRSTLLDAIRAEAPGLMVVPAEPGEDLGDLLAEIEPPILLVRDVE